MAEEEKEQPIIIKKIVKGGGHHGGAWKVAYADFVTAMMAFFLLLWLLNVTTEEQKNAISNYFDPSHPKVSQSQSGAGGVMGGLSMSPQGSMATNVQNFSMPNTQMPRSSTQAHKYGDKKSEPQKKKSVAERKENAIEKAKEIMRKKEKSQFKKTQDAIKQAIQDDPDLAQLAKNLIVDMTPEGLRIQIVDQDGASMFASGSSKMFDKTKTLMAKMSELIKGLPNEISIRGHTDSVSYGPGADYTNWELSTERANASRRVLLESGFAAERLNNVVGKADTEHLLPDDPKNAQNRRISIVLLKEEITNPEAFKQRAEETAVEAAMDAEESDGDYSEGEDQDIVPIGTFRKTPGQVQFP